MAMSNEMKQGHEAALSAAALARATLLRNRTQIQAFQQERERVLFETFQQRFQLTKATWEPDSRVEFDLRSQAGFVWLEFLGPVFGMPQEGHIVQVYSRVGDFLLSIVDKENSALVAKSLKDASLLLEGGKSLTECMTSYYQGQIQLGKLSSKAKSNKVTLWKTVERPCACSRLVLVLNSWHKMWSIHSSYWESYKYLFRRIVVDLVEFAEILRFRANAYNWSPMNEEEWVELEAKRLLTGQQQLLCRKRKEREGMEEEEVEEADMEALRADKERSESERKRLEDEIAKLTAALDLEKAALAEFERRYETETACQICLSSPRNAVLLPCRHGQFCGPCIQEHQKVADTCPTCRAKIKAVAVSI